VPTELRVGVQHRYDDIHVGLHLTEQRQRYNSVRDDFVQQSLSSRYAALEQQWTDGVRTESSLRVDHYRFDVTDLLGPNRGKGHETQLSPKFNLVYAPVDGIETFFSAGRGFHSNDARGATIKQDPVSGDAGTTEASAGRRSCTSGGHSLSPGGATQSSCKSDRQILSA
jgi:outer membrane receptor protein involved in Fe transport